MVVISPLLSRRLRFAKKRKKTREAGEEENLTAKRERFATIKDLNCIQQISLNNLHTLTIGSDLRASRRIRPPR
jgi:hypothetical protein